MPFSRAILRAKGLALTRSEGLRGGGAVAGWEEREEVGDGAGEGEGAFGAAGGAEEGAAAMKEANFVTSATSSTRIARGWPTLTSFVFAGTKIFAR